MEFAENEMNADGRAALALMAGLIKVLRDGEVFDREEIHAIFEHALRAVPEESSNTNAEARDLVLALREEMAPE